MIYWLLVRNEFYCNWIHWLHLPSFYLESAIVPMSFGCRTIFAFQFGILNYCFFSFEIFSLELGIFDCFAFRGDRSVGSNLMNHSVYIFGYLDTTCSLKKGCFDWYSRLLLIPCCVHFFFRCYLYSNFLYLYFMNIVCVATTQEIKVLALCLQKLIKIYQKLTVELFCVLLIFEIIKELIFFYKSSLYPFSFDSPSPMWASKLSIFS